MSGTDAEIVIPVFHITLAGELLSSPLTADPLDFIKAEPCINIGFFYDSDAFNGVKKRYHFDRCWALLDTGADTIFVDYSLIQKYECPIADGGQNMTINAQPGHTAHKGCFMLLQNNSVISLWVQGSNLLTDKRPIAIILGRRFLQFCTLLYDGHHQAISLKYSPRANAY
ncbi:MAG: hypothetical protein ABSD21_08485 [Rhizomicrobium sp.]|jgi:hypothetical protein